MAREPNTIGEARRRRAEELRGTREQRCFAAEFELRDDNADGTVTMIGHASVTETPYDVGGYTETISRGAFKRSLSQGPRVVLLVNHEGLPLASTRGGTLALEEDGRGLKFTAQLDPQDADVDRVVRKVRRGDLTDASFAFRVTDQKWTDDHSQRRILGVELTGGDVAVVTHGANPAASVAVRAAGTEPRPLPDLTTRRRERLAVLRAGAPHGSPSVAGADPYRERLAKLARPR